MSARRSKKSKKKRVLLGVAGSIAAYKACDIIRRLQDKGYSVRVVMTEAAKEFITPLTLSRLSEHTVYCEMFDKDASWDSSHIGLAEYADVFLIAPASANVIGKMAHGIADNLLLCTVLTTKAKILVAPAMNAKMYQNKIVQENCAKLKGLGIKFIEPRKGRLACGTVGEGRLAEVEDIVKAVSRVAR